MSPICLLQMLLCHFSHLTLSGLQHNAEWITINQHLSDAVIILPMQVQDTYNNTNTIKPQPKHISSLFETFGQAGKISGQYPWSFLGWLTAPDWVAEHSFLGPWLSNLKKWWQCHRCWVTGTTVREQLKGPQQLIAALHLSWKLLVLFRSLSLQADYSEHAELDSKDQLK